MNGRRARINDLFALLTVGVIIGIDQWLKTIVVANLQPGEDHPLVAHYLSLQFVLNKGAAFSIFNTNTSLLTIAILLALGLILFLYARIWNTGSLGVKIVFGMILGGAAGNLIDRFFRGGAVVDYISFRIPEIKFYFAVFNFADIAISLGVISLFLILFFQGGKLTGETLEQTKTAEQKMETLGATEQDG